MVDDTPADDADLHPQVQTSLNRTILAIAIPALGTLIAEPLLTLSDSAMVGHLGTGPLAGLAAGSTILTFAVGLCIFLAYTTTAMTARAVGAGEVGRALRTGVQGLWLALVLGIVLAICMFLGADWLTRAIGTTGVAVASSATYIRASSPGIVGMLVVLAGNGIMRGLLDTKTPLAISTVGAIANVPISFVLIYPVGLGVAGAGYGTAIAQTGMAIALAVIVGRACRREGVSPAPSLRLMASAGVTGAPLIVRTLCLQVALLLTVSAAAMLGSATLATHQVLKSLWSLSAFGMDALAIAAQALVGQALGLGRKDEVRGLLHQLTRWGACAGLVFGLVIAVLSPVLPYLFTSSPEVVTMARWGLLPVAACQILAGVVYMYDGILIGASDSRYLALAQVITLAVYAPVILVVGHVATPGVGGVIAIWLAFGIVLFGMRWLTLWLRIRTDKWMN